MRIVFAGNGERGEKCLSYLSRQPNIDIPLVICHPGEVAEGYYRSISKHARNLGFATISPEDINSEDTIKLLELIKPDLMLLVGYSAKILKKKTYGTPNLGTLNVHASLLPKYRGAAPLNWAMINGESECGISIIEVDEGVDTGPILAQVQVQILLEDDIATLTGRVNDIIPCLVMDVIKNHAVRKINQRMQSISEGFFCCKRKPKDGLLDFKTKNALEIVRMGKALVPPYPGAYFEYRGNKVTLIKSDVCNIDYRGIPGRIVSKDNRGVVILAKDKGVIIFRIMVNDDEMVEAWKYGFKLGGDISED